MQKSFMRIPYTGPLPPPVIIPRSANTPTGALFALRDFLTAPPSPHLVPSSSSSSSSSSSHAETGHRTQNKTVLLTGAGVSVASGLADYRGTAGTYTLNKTYRPIYYAEFLASHEARKRYWARSFLGWTTLNRARPNAAHRAVEQLGALGLVGGVITQNVDSFHPLAHPRLPTVELHGYLRSLVCVSCGAELDRAVFQRELARLNPAWATFLAEMLESGALDTENPEERKRRGYRSNPDGDVDVPDAPYTTFRYPPCPACLESPPALADGTAGKVGVDAEGAWSAGSNAGILKPAVIMFGESIKPEVKAAAERAVDGASRILVVGSSLATYSAWRLVRQAQERRMPIGVLNLGGIRGEDKFFHDLPPQNQGAAGVRCNESAEKLLPALVESLGGVAKKLSMSSRSVQRSASFGRME